MNIFLVVHSHNLSSCEIDQNEDLEKNLKCVGDPVSKSQTKPATINNNNNNAIYYY